MAFISSPVTYPPSSSPNLADAPRTKRRKVEESQFATDKISREPLQHVEPNSRLQGGNRQSEKTFGGFLMDDTDDEEGQEEVNAVRGSPSFENLQQSNRDMGRDDGRNFDLQLQPATTIISDSLDTPQEDSHDSTVKPTFSYTCSGKRTWVRRRTKKVAVAFEEMVASRSEAVPGRARRSYYGIEIHRLIDEANLHQQEKQEMSQEIEQQQQQQQQQQYHDSQIQYPAADDQVGLKKRKTKNSIWTEKYRARKFTDLIGDERTHRSVLKWLKAWDPIVFPGATRPKLKKRPGIEEPDDERIHRKILLLTGPAGLGKTTLAHVCARQAGYEVQEINASDERSKDVVKGRIRDMVGTENVRSMGTTSNLAAGSLAPKVSRPVCVVVDEVDGVVTGNSSGGGGGEGGFIKALMDLLILDQKNSNKIARGSSAAETYGKKKGDSFRLLRPIILICNDVYHPSLRPLRQATMAEIIHIRKPPIGMVTSRVQAIFEREGIPCDIDGARSLCEAVWGVSNNCKDGDRSNGTGEGDIRGILVMGEWVARRLRCGKPSECSSSTSPIRLSKKWLQEHVLGDLAHGGGAARSLGRGGSKEIVDRVFAYNAGFPAVSGQMGNSKVSNVKDRKQFKVPDASTNDIKQSQSGLVADSIGKQIAVDRLRQMIECSGEDDRVVTDCFTSYPTLPYQDDTYLSKPDQAYDWLHFHDTLSSLVHHSQEWELAAYLSSPVLAFHHLFASRSPNSYASVLNASSNFEDPSSTNASNPSAASVLAGPRAAYTASEFTKANSSTLQHLHTSLSLPLQRSFHSSAGLSTDLLPYLLRMLHPDIKPVLVHTSSSSSSSSSAAGGAGSNGGGATASVRRGAEKERVARAVQAMIACGVRFERGRVDFDSSPDQPDRSGPAGSSSRGWVYRMEPPLDALAVYETMANGAASGAGAGAEKVRYGVRQVLQQECQRELVRREQEARMARMKAVSSSSLVSVVGLENQQVVASTVSASAAAANATALAPEIGTKGMKRDFFGNPITHSAAALASSSRSSGGGAGGGSKVQGGEEGNKRRAEAEDENTKKKPRIWISYNEGFSNAVRKGITLRELLHGL